MPLDQDFENPNYLENIIRQKTLMQSMGSPMPESSPIPQNSQASTPDLTVHHLVGTMPNSAPSQPAPAQNTIQPEAQQAMIPKVGPINPIGPHPLQDQNIQAQMNEPMHANYHPSKLRNVLSQIAGVATGAFQGGPEGARVMAGIRDAPYNEQHSNWQQYAKNKLGLANEEYSQTAGKASEDANVALANLRRKQAGIIPNDVAGDIDKETQIRRASLAGTLPEDVQVELKDHNKVWAIEDPNTGVLYQKDATAKNGRGAVISDDAYIKRSEKGKSLTESPKNENPFNAYMEGILTKDPNKSKDKIALDWVNKETAGKDKNKAEFDTFYAGYKKDHPNAKDHQIVAAYAALPRPIPGVTVLSPTPSGGYKPIGLRAGGPEVPGDIVTPAGVNTKNIGSGEQRSAQFQAKIISKAGDNLIAKINQHRDKVGNLEDYWSKYTNNSPIADKDISGLMASLGSFAALQPKLHGFRGQQALREFEGIIGGVPKDPDALIAAIQAIQDTAGLFNEGQGGPSQGDMIDAQIPGQPAGKIHRAQRDAFLKKYPNAKVGQ